MREEAATPRRGDFGEEFGEETTGGSLELKQL